MTPTLLRRFQFNVSLLIRAFQNTDVQPMCRMFAAHFAAIDQVSSLTPLSFELCVLAKPYFEPEMLLVAELDQQLVGCLLMGWAPDDSLQTLSRTAGVVSGLFVQPHSEESLIAAQLLVSGQQAMSQRGCRSLRFCPPPPAAPYLAGMVPGDNMIGVSQTDVRQRGWLTAAGWQAGELMAAWELDLTRFQPPVDRTQIQIRRTAHVVRLLDEPIVPWYIASLLGHTEPFGFQLTTRHERKLAAEVILWMIGHELLPQPDVIAFLWPLMSADDSSALDQRASQDQQVFLLAEALRQLREDRVDLVRTVSLQNDTRAASLLTRVGFGQFASGQLFSIPLG